MFRRYVLAAAVCSFVAGGQARAEDAGKENELSGEGEAKIIVDLRGVIFASAIYRICIHGGSDSLGTPLIVRLRQDRRPKTVKSHELKKRDGEQCIDLGVRRDRYIEVASTKTDKTVKFSYRLLAAF